MLVLLVLLVGGVAGVGRAGGGGVVEGVEAGRGYLPQTYTIPMIDRRTINTNIDAILNHLLYSVMDCFIFSPI